MKIISPPGIKTFCINFLLFGTLYGAFVMTYFYMFSTSRFVQLEYKQLVTAQFNTRMIEDIYPHALFGRNCNSGYVYLLFGKTDHHDSGIYCQGTNCQNSIVYDELSRKNINSWRDTYFCVKYLSNSEGDYYTYYNSPIYTSCPANTRDCGVVDTIGSHLCLDINNRCPINQIQIVPRDSPRQINFTRIETDSDKDGLFDIQFTRENSQMNVQMEMKVSHGRVCSLYYERDFDREAAARDNETFYYYNKCETRLGGLKYHPNYVPLDSYYGFEIFDNLDLAYRENPHFPVNRMSSNKEYFLSNMLYPGDKCYSEFKQEMGLTIIDRGTEDYDFSSHKTMTVLFGCLVAFLTMILWAVGVLAFGDSTKDSLIIGCFGNICACCYFLPFMITFFYFGIKMAVEEGDLIINVVFEDRFRECLGDFMFQNQQIQENMGGNTAMLIYMAVFHSLIFLYYLVMFCGTPFALPQFADG